ncbi:TetR/AcrR family transcriptional regulator [Anaerobacillus alkaliphilus]|uniref:TetR/AcrR family transcriptional regulator n=1 Tax=Anaerobacillus alkaliphilus TaxID=1548597 RepID=A0A4Q0VMP2_9BACI|nr:TetR/AcrR family transcriptional regulator [Anaerobacillus alkaliphilus]RXI96226.1 TetR/AcrR family transcriptional regulator [Anaerobacillus alkaliphilus]
MSSHLIKEAALTLFAEKGYEGTSLAQIADEVGLKKQSLYSHFKSKDDLFLQVLTETFAIEYEREKEFLHTHFEEPLSDYLWKSLRNYTDRYHNDSRQKFLLRTSFFPPSHLYQQVIHHLYDHIERVDALYLQRFEQGAESKEMKKTDPLTATMAFSTLIDSICVELVYGSKERTEKKLQAGWTVYWNGIA